MSATIDTTNDLSLVPGAMEYEDRRELDSGVIEFETAPAGWLAKNGEVRKRDWRAYHWTPAGGDRVRVPSVSTVLDSILPKPGLPPWSEARGIEGAVHAVRLGLIDPATEVEETVGIVRRNRLGADSARDEAADRGLSIHALLADYMLTGSAPKLADHPIAHHGYIVALVDWLKETDPEPERVEEMVCSPEDGYAGRTDLVARSGQWRIRYDAKTQERCAIYESAHVQVKLYDRGAVACGDEPADLLKVVVFAADGEYREMPCMADDAMVAAGLAWFRATKPVTSACESANRVERKARA